MKPYVREKVSSKCDMETMRLVREFADRRDDLPCNCSLITPVAIYGKLYHIEWIKLAAWWKGSEPKHVGWSQGSSAIHHFQHRGAINHFHKCEVVEWGRKKGIFVSLPEVVVILTFSCLYCSSLRRKNGGIRCMQSGSMSNKEKSKGKTLKRLISFCRPEWGRVCLGAAALAVNSATNLSFPCELCLQSRSSTFFLTSSMTIHIDIMGQAIDRASTSDGNGDIEFC